MDFIIDAIVEWLKGLLVDGIMGNLDGLFDNVNQSVGEIATQVGTTPTDWNAGVFSMIRQISETAILPIAGVILTFVMTYELIQMLIERNNLHEIDTWMFFKWVFKTFVAVMMEEATKYIGWPYVWGGSSPSTSFDCSGFVCWVYTASGVHNLPRTTAQGIYNQCAIISPSEAKPGDIIFFTGTYDSPGPVSHVGIYVGDGMMLHCGSPIQYANINSSYWQTHFYAFGRL